MLINYPQNCVTSASKCSYLLRQGQKVLNAFAICPELQAYNNKKIELAELLGVDGTDLHDGLSHLKLLALESNEDLTDLVNETAFLFSAFKFYQVNVVDRDFNIYDRAYREEAWLILQEAYWRNKGITIPVNVDRVNKLVKHHDDLIPSNDGSVLAHNLELLADVKINLLAIDSIENDVITNAVSLAKEVSKHNTYWDDKL